MPRLRVQLAISNPLDLIVEVEIAQRSSQLQGVSRSKAPPPNSSTYRTKLLVDTGSTLTILDEVIATALNLPMRGAVPIYKQQSGGLAVHRPLHAASMVIFDTSNAKHQSTLVSGTLVGVDKPHTYLDIGIGGVLGMDLLSLGTISYDGPGKSCVLTWPQSLNPSTFSAHNGKP